MFQEIDNSANGKTDIDAMIKRARAQILKSTMTSNSSLPPKLAVSSAPKTINNSVSEKTGTDSIIQNAHAKLMQSASVSDSPLPPKPTVSSAPKPMAKNNPNRADQEFLPAALEILETPPSPVMTSLILLMAAFVITALIWAWFGRIDIIATAQGKIQPLGRIKIVQPVESGKVIEIKARNGEHVARGDVLVELEPSDALADVNSVRAATLSYEAEILRRTAALEAARNSKNLSSTPKVNWPDHIPLATRQREEAVLGADLAQLRSQINSIATQADIKRSEVHRLNTTIEAQKNLISILKSRVSMRSDLVASGYSSKATVIDSKEALQRETAVLVGENGQLGESESAIKSLTADREKQIEGFINDNTQKRTEAMKQFDDFREKLKKTNTRLGHMSLLSPADGTVQASSIFTIGQVVSAGQEVMRIVPTDTKLEVEAYLPNKEIGFVNIGQEVNVKVESFPFTRFGMLTGHVSQLARDAIPLPEASQTEGNPAQSTNASTFAGAERTQNLVFPITIILDHPELIIEGKPVTMSPGMTVSAEIKTGSRSILEYVLSPLVETASQAMNER